MSTDWVLETRVGSHYRGVVRHPLTGAYRVAGLVLIEFAGIGEAELAGDAPGVTFRPRHHLRHRHLTMSGGPANLTEPIQSATARGPQF